MAAVEVVNVITCRRCGNVEQAGVLPISVWECIAELSNGDMGVVYRVWLPLSRSELWVMERPPMTTEFPVLPEAAPEEE